MEEALLQEQEVQEALQVHAQQEVPPCLHQATSRSSSCRMEEALLQAPALQEALFGLEEEAVQEEQEEVIQEEVIQADEATVSSIRAHM